MELNNEQNVMFRKCSRNVDDVCLVACFRHNSASSRRLPGFQGIPVPTGILTALFLSGSLRFQYPIALDEEHRCTVIPVGAYPQSISTATLGRCY
jgi:hypothetical protein